MDIKQWVINFFELDAKNPKEWAIKFFGTNELKQWAIELLSKLDSQQEPELRQLGRVAAREINVIHDRFEQLGVRAEVNTRNITASDTGNFIRYPLIATGKISSIESIEADLCMAISMHRGVETEVHLRQPMLAIELPFPLATRPLVWGDAKLSTLQPFQAILGMDYTLDTPKTTVLDFGKRHIGHVLVAGASGSGKTVELINLIVSLCHSTSPEDLQIIFIDSKFDEDWAQLPGLPHVSMFNEPAECAAAIASVKVELESRKRNPDKRKIILIVDEYADLRSVLGGAGDAVDADIRAITNVGRSKGVHVVMCTQKPVIEILDSVGKGNMTSRVCLQVMTSKESEIGMGRGGIGCEDLPGLGAFNAILGGGRVIRGQSYLLENEALADAIDAVNAKWSNAKPYRIEMIEPEESTQNGASFATMQVKLQDRPLEWHVANVKAHPRYNEAFNENGEPQKGAKGIIFEMIFGEGATNGGRRSAIAKDVFDAIVNG